MNWRALIKVIAFICVAGFMAAMEIGTLTGPHVGTTHDYHAIFATPDGVSGLREGNEVKVAGVAVGSVTSIDLLDARHAKVTFSLNTRQTLTDRNWAVVRYANLIGQRYLAITQDPKGPGRPVEPGYTIPPERTMPALSLTSLFNGFRPLFAALTPDQVNELAGDIIDILQGQSGRISDLVAHTASFTTNIAQRSGTVSEVLDGLTQLLTTVSAHDAQLAGMITSLRSLSTVLAEEGPAILDSLQSVDGLTGSVSSLLQRLRDNGLSENLAALDHVTGVLAHNTPTVQRLIDGFVVAFTDFSRVTQDGSFVSSYICQIGDVTVGQTSITGQQVIDTLGRALGIGKLTSLLTSLGLIQLILKPLVPVPLNLPNGVAGASTHTKVCR